MDAAINRGLGAKPSARSDVRKDRAKAIGASAQRREQAAPARPVDKARVIAFARIPQVAVSAERSHLIGGDTGQPEAPILRVHHNGGDIAKRVRKAVLLPEDLRAEIEAL